MKVGKKRLSIKEIGLSKDFSNKVQSDGLLDLPHREKLVQRTAGHYLCRDYSKVETLVPIGIPHIVLMSID